MPQGTVVLSVETVAKLAQWEDKPRGLPIASLFVWITWNRWQPHFEDSWRVMSRLNSDPAGAQCYPFVAEIELRDLQFGTLFKKRTDNLSLSGCHVATRKLLPRGTRVMVKIDYAGARFEALGKVVCVRYNSGMGVAFTQIESNSQRILRQWLTQRRTARGRKGVSARRRTAETQV